MLFGNLDIGFHGAALNGYFFAQFLAGFNNGNNAVKQRGKSANNYSPLGVGDNLLDVFLHFFFRVRKTWFFHVGGVGH